MKRHLKEQSFDKTSFKKAVISQNAKRKYHSMKLHLKEQSFDKTSYKKVVISQNAKEKHAMKHGLQKQSFD